MPNRLPFTPDFIQTDNGFELQVRFDKYCEERGLRYQLIHKSTPMRKLSLKEQLELMMKSFSFVCKLHLQSMRNYEYNLPVICVSGFLLRDELDNLFSA